MSEYSCGAPDPCAMRTIPHNISVDADAGVIVTSSENDQSGSAIVFDILPSGPDILWTGVSARDDQVHVSTITIFSTLDFVHTAAVSFEFEGELIATAVTVLVSCEDPRS